MTCKNCGSIGHTTEYCVSNIITGAPCQYCGSKEHPDVNCPCCRNCGSTKHTTDKCNFDANDSNILIFGSGGIEGGHESKSENWGDDSRDTIARLDKLRLHPPTPPPKVKEAFFEFTYSEFYQTPVPECRFVYQPAKPFRLSSLLVWEGDGMITSLTVANIEQVIGGIPLQYFEAPFPLEHAKAAIEQGMLEQCLPDRFKGLYFPTCNPDCGTIITISYGSFKHLMFWGVELI